MDHGDRLGRCGRIGHGVAVKPAIGLELMACAYVLGPTMAGRRRALRDKITKPTIVTANPSMA